MQIPQGPALPSHGSVSDSRSPENILRKSFFKPLDRWGGDEDRGYMFLSNQRSMLQASGESSAAHAPELQLGCLKYRAIVTL